MKSLVLAIMLLHTLLAPPSAPASEQITEIEPNDSPATANALKDDQTATGALTPVGDVDFYEVDGVNQQWGYMAILDTASDAESERVTLTAYATDGTTVLQSDSGGWAKGAVIALQSFVDGKESAYIGVSEHGNDQSIDGYHLRYHTLALSSKPESEPNDTPATAQTAAKTNTGIIESADDVDCYAFHIPAEQDFMFALNGDPENDAAGADYTLTVYDSAGILLATADHNGNAGNEFIDTITLPAMGVYTFCVSGSGGDIGMLATYRVGLLRVIADQARNWWPDFIQDPQWLDPRPGNYAKVGDTMTFKLSLKNGSPLPLPDEFRLMARFDSDCVSVLDAPGADSIGETQVRWTNDGLGPFEELAPTVVLQAKANCAGEFRQSVSTDYYVLGFGETLDYMIGEANFLPMLIH